MGIQFSHGEENIVGKEEIAAYEHLVTASPANLHFCASKFANYKKLGPAGANRGSH